MPISCNTRFTENHISLAETQACIRSNGTLIQRVRQGLEWKESLLSWLSVDTSAPEANLEDLVRTARYVQELATVMIVIGIGGSNRGAIAGIQALHRSLKSPTRVVFAGDTLSTVKIQDTLALMQTESIVLNVIAKDFNTVEPGITFRVLREAMQAKYGSSYHTRIIVTGSTGPGQLQDLARLQGYHFLEFPKNIGGRFSVLSNVGLFPMAVAGIDIRKLCGGARETEFSLKHTDSLENPAVRYAVNRLLLLEKGFQIESLVVYEPDLVPFARWFVQLFAETEGKTSKALLPTFFSYSEDLHAVGQFVQQGPRTIIETLLNLFFESPSVIIHPSPEVGDGFDYLDNQPFDKLNQSVYQAALSAHVQDNIPCFEFVAGKGICEETLGSLFYFFMFACYLSACLLQVNPFNQDGVENYKKNLYALLGKPVLAKDLA